MSGRLQVVCLDAAGTLFTERSSRAALYAEVFGAAGVPVPVPQMARWMGELHDELPDELPGGRRYSAAWFRAFVQQLLTRAGSGLEPEPLRVRLAARFTDPATYVVFADTFPALDDLAQAGLRLALVSNWSDQLPRLLEQLGLLACFEVLAVSQLVGCEKPQRGLFEHALARLGVPPEHALHVGDHPRNDVAGARAAGLAALLLDRRPGAVAGPGVITSLADLPERLGVRR